jgi:hypothetical protein
MSDADVMGCLALIEHGKWKNGMNEENVRRILGRRVIGDDEIMAVVFGLGLWGGFKVDDRRCMTIDLGKFCLWVKCLCNRVLDQEACAFLKSKFNVDVQPDSRSVNFDIPEELAGSALLKNARETAAELNFGLRQEKEAKRNWRQSLKRHRHELLEEAPPTRRTRWDSDEEFGVVETPEFYEDCVS